jgi:GNAT superfamily N-acetyltransferase
MPYRLTPLIWPRRKILDIVPVESVDLEECFNVLSELRSFESFESFRARLSRQKDKGYVLLAAVENGNVIGLIGYQFGENFARGKFVNIDDLVVSSHHRANGVGTRLLNHVKDIARESGAVWFFLNARKEAIPFYEKYGLEFHQAPAMKCKLD